MTGVDISYRKWTGYDIDVDIFPRTGFQTKFEEIGQVFHQFNQGSHVVFIDLFLSDILLRQEFGNSLWIYKGLEFSANGIVQGDTGIFEKLQNYTIGFTRNDDLFAKSFPMDNYLIAIEAKNKLGADDLLTCFAQAASLYKIRVDAGKADKNIWAILSDAETWRVIYIDNDGKVGIFTLISTLTMSRMYCFIPSSLLCCEMMSRIMRVSSPSHDIEDVTVKLSLIVHEYCRINKMSELDYNGAKWSKDYRPKEWVKRATVFRYKRH